MTPTPLIVVVGMVRESRIVAGEGVIVLIGGGQSAHLSRDIEQAITNGAAGVVSFGLCGGLNPALNAGDLVIDTDDPAWSRSLRSALPDARPGRFIGGDTMVASVTEKARLHRDSGADAVDMESHIVMAAARRAHLPYAIIRAVSDPSDRALPKAALAGLKADGEANVAGVIGALVHRPWDLPALLRTAAEAKRAFMALETARAVLGKTLGCPKLPDAM